MSKKVKIGIIGTGSISSEHIKAYLKNPDAELYALCDIVEDRVKAAAERYGVGHVFTDMNEMLKLKEIAAVSVCTWNSAHMPCAVAALNAGKHVCAKSPCRFSLRRAINEGRADKNHKL